MVSLLWLCAGFEKTNPTYMANDANQRALDTKLRRSTKSSVVRARAEATCHTSLLVSSGAPARGQEQPDVSWPHPELLRFPK